MNRLKIIISCDEANHSCDKSQYKEASFWEKVKLNIHLIYCAACRKYTKNNKNLTQKIQTIKDESLSKKSKDSIQKAFNEAQKKQFH